MPVTLHSCGPRTRDSPRCLQLLIQAGAGVNTGDRDGVTALMNEGGHEVCVNTLLQAGADVNKRSNNGFTAYMFAMKGNHQACMQRLLEAGATFGASDGLRFMAAGCKALLEGTGDSSLCSTSEITLALL